MFKNSKNKDEAWKLLDFLFTTEQRAKFTQGEGFLPVNKEEAKMDYYVNNADLAAFTALLPDARFAPVIPGWEKSPRSRPTRMQKIYLGERPRGGPEGRGGQGQRSAEANRAYLPAPVARPDSGGARHILPMRI